MAVPLKIQSFGLFFMGTVTLHCRRNKKFYSSVFSTIYSALALLFLATLLAFFFINLKIIAWMILLYDFKSIFEFFCDLIASCIESIDDIISFFFYSLRNNVVSNNLRHAIAVIAAISFPIT